jgi:cysteine synthase
MREISKSPEVIGAIHFVALHEIAVFLRTLAAVEMTRRVAREKGILVGPSPGANIWCASRLSNKRQRVVTVLSDRAERYFSTALI